MIETRQAVLPDVGRIHAILQPYAATGVLLPRSLAELCENVRDFMVALEDGRIAGCGALHLYGMHLAEIRSIAVAPETQRRGVGSVLVRALIQEAKRQSVGCICLFTRSPEFFARLGFQTARRDDLPDKIYKDCVCCPNLYDCDEVAMYTGELPPNTNGLRDPRVLIPLVRGK